MSLPPFQLVVHSGQDTEAHSFGSEVRKVVIGRSRECDLVLRDRRVSRRHCRIECRDGSFVLHDEGAQNPVKLRGIAVDEAELRFGDTFTVGGSDIEFRSLAEEPASLDDTFVPEGQQNARDLSAFVQIARALNEEQDLSRLLTLIVDSAINLSGAERGFLILGQGRESTVEIARNFAQEEVHTPEFKISRTIAQRVLETGVAELTTNAQEDVRFRALASVTDLRLRSVLCIPVRIRGKAEGIVYVDNRLQNQVFKEREKALLMSLADHAGIALHNARTMRELRAKRADLESSVARVAQLNSALKGEVSDQRAELQEMRQQLVQATHEGRYEFDYRAIVGNSRRMHDVFQLLDRYIPAADPVLILGESGTGKELVARAIHRLGPRAQQPFVSENCAALPESLLESELFGYIKGAFTGANKSRKGLLVAASGGVLFLDEIGDMSVDLQKKLLRVLQEKEVRPLGGQQMIPIDVRLVTATNRNLEELVHDGEFREDLYYRINVLPIQLPPLRERRDDIPAHIERILGEMAGEDESKRVRVSPDAMAALARHRWPGNVRELQNEIRRAAILADGVILESHLSNAITNPAPGPHSIDGPVPAERGTTLPELVRDLEIGEITRAMRQSHGNKSRTAEMLGVSRFALQRKLEKYRIELDASEGESEL